MDGGDKAEALRSRLARARVVGLFLKLPGFEAIDCAQAAGFDFAVIDREHSSLDERSVFDQIAYGRALGLPLLVRLPRVDPPLIGRLLDAGAAGFQISDVTRRAEVEALIAATRFPPEGERGLSPSVRVGGYGRIPVPEYVRTAPDPLTVIQIERASTADALGELLDQRVDVCYVGAVDLSADLGAPGEFNEAVRARVAEICAAAEAAGVAVGAHGAGDSVDPRTRYLTVGTDVTALAGSLAELRSRGRGAR